MKVMRQNACYRFRIFGLVHVLSLSSVDLVKLELLESAYPPPHTKKSRIKRTTPSTSLKSAQVKGIYAFLVGVKK